MCATLVLAGCGGGDRVDASDAGVSTRSAATAATSGEGRAKALAVTPQQAALARWGEVQRLPLVPAAAAVLGNGKVLLWASNTRTGFGGGGSTFTSLFDPSTGVATDTNVSVTGHDMFCPGTAFLPDGRMLVNGGVGSALTSLYDPVSNVWTRGANMNVPRGYNASTTLADGSVLTVGGSWSGGVGAKDAEVYTPAGVWRRLSGVSTATATLNTSDSRGLFRSDNHMWLLPTGNGRVLHAGPSKNMHWIDVAGNGTLAPAGKRADDSDSMSGNAVMYDAGKILTLGGSVNYENSNAKRDAFVIDTSGGSLSTRRVGAMVYPRVYGNSVVLPNGQVVVVGGQSFGQVLADSNSVLPAELYDPETETFTALPAMSVPRNYHSVALLLPDGRVMSAGGGLCNCAADHPDLQLLSPPYLFNADGSAATRPVITNAPASVGYGVNVNVTTNSAVTAFSMVRLGAATHTVNNDQRRVRLSFTSTGPNTYSVAVPRNPGILLPGQWMLFAMNAQGTPSVARIVTVNGAGAPVLSNPGNLAAVAGGTVNVPLTASTPSDTLSFSATGLPPGVSINPSTGTLSGTATQAGSFVVTISASNGTQTVSTDVLFVVNLSGNGTGTGLLGQYFNNTNVSGTPVLQRAEAPNFDWVTAAPGAGVPADNFSVRWSGWLEPTATGGAQIRTLSDDGVRVWIDNQLVIDNWSVHALTADTASVNLVAGRRVPITIEYYGGGGNATLRLQWQQAGSSGFVAVPANRLYPTPAPATTNTALGRTATQSSTYTFGVAARAVDGNTAGDFVDGAAVGTVTHTASAAAQDWWQVDLGRSVDIDRVQLWNRTNCCGERLANFTLFVSATDMTGRSFDQLTADASVVKRRVGVSQITPQISLPVGAAGRFVRVQLQGRNFLQLAEVEVYGRDSIVYREPTMAAIAAQQDTLGRPASLTVVANEPDGRALNFNATGLPPGLAINAASGVVSGTPTTVGVFNTVVTARNAGDLSASRSFVWTIRADGLPTVTTVPAPVARTGTALTYAPVVIGGVGAQYSWNFGDGSPATAFSGSATVSKTFAAPGVYTVTLNMRAADGSQGSYRFVQAVAGAPATVRARSSTDVLLEPRAGASARVWVVNPDNDSVSVFDASSLQRLAEINVGSGPRTLARAGDGRIWVVNKTAATVSIVDAGTLAVAQTLALPRASQPYGIVISPTDGAAFVTLEASGRLLKLSAAGATLANAAVGDNPRHLAISADGTRLLLSRFITRALPGESTPAVRTKDAANAAVGGEVLSLNPANLAVTRTTVLAHSDRLDSESQGRGFPNYLGAPVIAPDGNSAWVPSKQDNLLRGALRDGRPLDFQNTVRAISSRIDLASGNEDLAGRIDHDNASLASAAAFHPSGAYLFVALETSRQVAVVDAAGRRELFRLDVGLAPQGLVLSADGTRLFVHNFMARSLSVLDLSPLLNAGQFVATTLATPLTVGTEKLAANVLRGKQLFYDARDPRLARDSYMSCASCHNDGGHDGRVWDLTHAGEGLRNTISLRGRAGGQGRLHWSANFDEVQDFEAQIRSLAGGRGLMDDTQFNAGTRRQPLGDAKAGLSADLDALAAYVASLNAFDNSPARQANGALTSDAVAGRAVFQAQCASCHAGTDFTDSSKKVLHNVGTQKAASGQRLGLALNGLDAPTLRDVWATAPYLHDGSAATLQDAVLAHGLNLSAADLAAVVSYTRQIGAEESAATPGTANLVVRAFSTLLDRVGAWFEVRVDGRTVGSGQIDATGPIDLLYNVAAFVANAVIEVVFKNDSSSATEDRNLTAQSVRVNGATTVNATDPGVVLDRGAGAAAFDGLDTLPGSSTSGLMRWNGATRFPVPAPAAVETVTVRVSSTLLAGVGANVELRINNVWVGSRLLTTTAVQDLVFASPVLRTGDRIDVVFTNDAVSATEDRNLFVQAVTTRGTVLSPTAAGVLIDRGSAAQAWDGLDTLPASATGGWLFWNAALRLVAR